LQIPTVFLGTGESYGDLKPFKAHEYAWDLTEQS
jgi:signal recognition particle GTPase